MIFYILRVLVVLVRQAFGPRLALSSIHELRFRAWPWSCDLNLHVNNAQVLVFMELARWVLTLRIGMLHRVIADKLQLLVGGVSVLYRHPLPMLRCFTLRTRVVAADARWFYFVQEIIDHQGRVAVRAVLRGLARQRDGVVSPRIAFGDQDLPELEGDTELAAFDALARQHLQELSRES